MNSLGEPTIQRASNVAAQDDEADIENELRNYIRANPGAGDTAIGVASFWLCMQPTSQNIALVERVLARLEAEGWCARSIVPAVPTGSPPATPEVPA